MRKIVKGPQTWIYPMPVILVGANVDGKPNLMTVAWCAVASSEPQMISLSIAPTRHTFRGILQNRTFSVNIPTDDLIKEVDYCGLVSGAKANKAEVCGFEVFYGKLGNAPLIEQCPINLECKVVHILDLGVDSLIVGRVEETHISENCLTNGKPDVTKIRPLIYTEPSPLQYHTLGPVIGKAFSIGKELKKQR